MKDYTNMRQNENLSDKEQNDSDANESSQEAQPIFTFGQKMDNYFKFKKKSQQTPANNLESKKIPSRKSSQDNNILPPISPGRNNIQLISQNDMPEFMIKKQRDHS